VRAEFEECTRQAFCKVAAEDLGPAEVAAELGMIPNAVRESKSRILRRIKEELGELIG
jgi:RNA polymerase sigma-70 factor (ECF subfamily)